MATIDELRSILRIGENDTTEFKQKLTKADLKKKRKEKLISRIRYMTHERPFEGTFLIGVEDLNGEEWQIFGLSESALKLSEKVLSTICDAADVEIIEETRVETTKGLVGIYLLKRVADADVRETCSINVAGRVNSGKSTLVGALVTGVPDDGQGRARSFLLTHPQEITRGQTADIHMAFMGFSRDQEPIHLSNPLSKAEWARVLDRSAKILMFFDAPGHKEFSKTMIRSILGGDADYGLVLIPIQEEANLIRSTEMKTGKRRLDDITREHLILISGRDVPFMIALSKVDKANSEDLEFVNTVTRQTLKEIGRIPVSVKTEDDIVPIMKEIRHGVVVPIIEASATIAESLTLLTKLLQSLPTDLKNSDVTGPAISYVDKVYRGIPGTNVVVTGNVRSGVFKKGQPVLIGPDEKGQYQEGRVASIEVFKKRVGTVKAGDMFGFDIKDVDKFRIRRGQVVIDPDYENLSSRIFEADIVVTRHPTRISVGYTPVLQCQTIQQSVIMKKIHDAEFLSVGDFATVQLEFMSYPEAISVGDKIVLREGNTRAIGTVTKIIE
ncbi:MAG: hypothetical protein BAJATHORv1_10640 [Candidatus Thorarchaeota archaeon]|nr:MAG: hypothetical protein BAJATHORv1_10640 [Candidatus Thorarchaeota archaeon]